TRLSPTHPGVTQESAISAGAELTSMEGAMSTTTSRLARRSAAGTTAFAVLAGALVTGGLLAMSTTAAQAKGTTLTFTEPGSTTWKVPYGVTSIDVTAYGGQG